MNTTNWMESLPDSIQINHVKIPGSHDSGSYGITTDSVWDSNRTDKTTSFFSSLFMKVPVINEKIILPYSKVQEVDLVQQFSVGVRYFDFRITKQNGDYYFTHGFVANSFFTEFKKLLEYIQDFPSEILIFDFRQFWGFDLGDHTIFQQKIHDMTIDRLAIKGEFSPKTKLEKFRRYNKTIIINYDNEVIHPSFWNHRKTIFPDSNDVSYIFSQLYHNLNEASNDKFKNKVWVFRTSPMPTASYIIKHIFNSPKRLSTLINTKLMAELSIIENIQFGNVIKCNFVDQSGLTNAIINLNFV